MIHEFDVCPFCAHWPEVSETGECVKVRCAEDGCNVQPSLAAATRDQAVDEWNRRTGKWDVAEMVSAIVRAHALAWPQEVDIAKRFKQQQDRTYQAVQIVHRIGAHLS